MSGIDTPTENGTPQGTKSTGKLPPTFFPVPEDNSKSSTNAPGISTPEPTSINRPTELHFPSTQEGPYPVGKTSAPTNLEELKKTTIPEWNATSPNQFGANQQKIMEKSLGSQPQSTTKNVTDQNPNIQSVDPAKIEIIPPTARGEIRTEDTESPKQNIETGMITEKPAFRSFVEFLREQGVKTVGFGTTKILPVPGFTDNPPRAYLLAIDENLGLARIDAGGGIFEGMIKERHAMGSIDLEKIKNSVEVYNANNPDKKLAEGLYLYEPQGDQKKVMLSYWNWKTNVPLIAPGELIGISAEELDKAMKANPFTVLPPKLNDLTAVIQANRAESAILQKPSLT